MNTARGVVSSLTITCKRKLPIITSASWQRTSNSLNEELPQKWQEKSFQENAIFSMERIVVLTIESSAKMIFSLYWTSTDLEAWVENYVSAIQHRK